MLCCNKTLNNNLCYLLVGPSSHPESCNSVLRDQRWFSWVIMWSEFLFFVYVCLWLQISKYTNEHRTFGAFVGLKMCCSDLHVQFKLHVSEDQQQRHERLWKRKNSAPLKPAVDVGRHMAVVVTTISLALFKPLYLLETMRSSIKNLTHKFLFPENWYSRAVKLEERNRFSLLENLVEYLQ